MKLFFGKKSRGWKRLCSLLLVAALVTTPFGMNGIAAFAEETALSFDIGKNPESVTAQLEAGGKLTISGVGEIQDFTPETAPFREVADQIVSVEIGAGVSVLGDYLFYNCGSLSGELELPEKLLRIGSGAFSGDSAQQAPKFDLVINPFTQASMASLKEEETMDVPSQAENGAEKGQKEEASGKPGEETAESSVAESAVSQSAPVSITSNDETAGESEASVSSEASEAAAPSQAETGAEETGNLLSSQPPEIGGESSASEASGVESSAAEEVPGVESGGENAASNTETGEEPVESKPLPTESPAPGNEENRYLIENLTQQKMGQNVFFPSAENAGRFFTCTQDNESFRAAMKEAGYTEAETLVTAAFECGEGNSSTGAEVVRRLPQKDGTVTLPQSLPEFTAPEGGELFSYTFGGWTESRDEAGLIREPGSLYEPQGLSDLYFIASWNRQVLVKIRAEYTDDALKLSVPDVEGYEFTSFLWQTCQISQGETMPEDQELLPWEGIPQAESQTYEKKMEPEDENRLFRCVVGVRRKQNLLAAFFSADRGEEVALAAVYGAQGRSVSGSWQITFNGGKDENGTAAGGEGPAAIAVAEGDYAVIPSCTYTSPDQAGLVVFNGWHGSDGKEYDPGEIIRPSSDLVLTAQWDKAIVRYVNGRWSWGNDGTTADQAARRISDVIDDFTGSSKYTNILVICGNVDISGSLAKDLTITNQDPGGSSHTGTLTITDNLTLGGGTYWHDLSLAANTYTRNNVEKVYGVFAQGNPLVVGENVTSTDYCVNLFGGYQTGSHSYSSKVILQSGSFKTAFGGNEGGNVTGNTSLQLSGSAVVGLAFGACWCWSGNNSTVSGNTEILMSGNSKAAVVAGGNRSSDGNAVTGKAHIMIGGHARVEDPSGTVIKDGEVGWDVGEFVAGSGADACTSDSSGNVQGGVLIEIRENAYVAGNVFGGSGDSWGGSGSSAEQKAYVGTSGDMEILVTGSAQIGQSVYGGGNNRSCRGSSIVTVSGNAQIGENVYGGGSNGGVSGSSSVSISGGKVTGSVYGGGNAGDIGGTSQVSFGGEGASAASVYLGGKSGHINGMGENILTVSGGTVAGSVYGGGDQGNLAGSSRVTLSGGAVGGSVYGGGNAGDVEGTSQVSFGGEGEITGNLYGGGKMGSVGAGTAVSIAGGTVNGSVYGGGEEGAVSGGSSAAVSGGAIKQSLFGGSKGAQEDSSTGAVTGDSLARITGGSLGSTDEAGNPIAETGNMYGGGEYASTSGAAAAVVGGEGSGSPSVLGSVYGGGSQAPAGTSSLEINSGEVRGSVFGAGFGASSSAGQARAAVSGGTVAGSVYGGGQLGSVGSGGAQVNITGGTMGSVFGAGQGDNTGADPHAGAVTGPTEVTVSGGTVGGSVFGGGDYGAVGAGSLSGTGAGLSMAVTTEASTSVTVTGGTIDAAVFGGGSGSGREDAFGAVFGSTSVTVSGGSMHNVFGGSNSSYVSGDTTVSVKAEQNDVAISGTVFGGGNLSGGEGEFQEIYLVQGSADVTVDGSGARNLSIGGSVYGSGNLTLVKDPSARTKITINRFNGELQSVQRSPRADILASNLYLVGADDVTEAVTRYYSLSQIEDLRLVDGTLLRVDKEARELGAIGNYVSSGSSMSASSAESSRSTLQVYQGKKLQIKSGDNFGPVNGVLWLDIVTKEAGASEYGVSIQASLDSDVGDGSVNTGAFVKANTASSEELPLVSGVIEGSYCFWRLGSATTQVDLTIRAEHEDNGGTGLAEQSFTVDTSAIQTVYAMTERKQTGSFFLVRPTEKADGSMDALPAFETGQNTGNTFALRIEAVNQEGAEAWNETGGAYILTADETNCGAPGIWQRNGIYPSTTTSGGNSAVMVQLLYSPSFKSFTGGTVEFALKEYAAGGEMTEETLESTTIVTLTIEGGVSGASREVYMDAGRKFQEISGTEPVRLTDSGAVTAYYITQYYPLSTGSQNMSLNLYKMEGGTPVQASLPKGTRVVLADLSETGRHHYYYYMVDHEGAASLGLSDFSSMAESGSAFYPGPLDNTTQITEKLLFAVDFSEASAPLAAGNYQLRLNHSQDASLDSTVPAEFSIEQGKTNSLTIGTSGEGASDTSITLVLTPTVSAADTRYADGVGIELTLSDSRGNPVGFPSAVQVGGSVSNDLRSPEGGISFSLPSSEASQVTLDFSAVPEAMLASGSYQISAGMQPRPGLQISVTSSTDDAQATPGPVPFTLKRNVQTAAVSAELKDASQRLADVSEGSALLEFTVSVEMEAGSSLEAEVMKKTGSGPGASSYSHLSGGEGWCSLGSVSGGSADASLTVPMGTESGTYRVVFRVKDADGNVLAEDPYNFIVP